MILKTLDLTSKNIEIKYSLINNKKFLVLQKDKTSIYFFIPLKITVFKKENFLNIGLLSLEKEEDKIRFNLFYLFLCNQFKNLQKPIIKCLLFKGLGLKVHLLTEKFLQLKLGYSHLINIIIPKDIKVTSIKNFLLIEGINAARVGNFADFIKKKRLPDLYKGKGIFSKNEIIKLKIIKKI